MIVHKYKYLVVTGCAVSNTIVRKYILASFPGPLLERLLRTTFDSHGLVQRSCINIVRGGEPGDEATQVPVSCSDCMHCTSSSLHLLGMTGCCLLTATVVFMSSRLASGGTRPWNGTWYGSAGPENGKVGRGMGEGEGMKEREGGSTGEDTICTRTKAQDFCISEQNHCLHTHLHVHVHVALSNIILISPLHPPNLSFLLLPYSISHLYIPLLPSPPLLPPSLPLSLTTAPGSSLANLPQDKPQCINIHILEGLKRPHVHSPIQHLRCHVPR